MHAEAGLPARIIAKMNSLVDPDGHRDALPRLAGRRADRPDRPRDLLPAARACRASPTTSGSSASSTSSSSTRGSPTSRTATIPRSSSPRPTGCRATSAAASRSCSRSRTRSSRRRLVDGILGVVLADNVKARELQPDGTYRRVPPPGPSEPVIRSPGRVPEHGHRAVRDQPDQPPRDRPGRDGGRMTEIIERLPDLAMGRPLWDREMDRGRRGLSARSSPGGTETRG